MIRELKVINWRAYENQTFNFSPGINFIMGPNGKGKTSILEAISFALTGEVSAIENRNWMLRDPNMQASVSLTFVVNENRYRIDRTQLPGKAGEALLIDLKDNQQLASSQRRVNDAIEELIGVSTDFLRRIVYMAEGDVFRFLQKPPGEVMNQQIRRVLGLTQLDQFISAIQLAKKDLNAKTKAIKSLQQRIKDLKLNTDEELETKLSDITKQKDNIGKQILVLESQITKLSQDTQLLSSLNAEINVTLPAWKTEPEVWNQIQNRSVIEYFDVLREDVDQEKNKIAKLEKNLARLDGQKDSYLRVMEILRTVDKADSVPCPVCKKPMTSIEQHTVEKDNRESISNIEKENILLQNELKILQKQVKSMIQLLESVGEIRNNLLHNQYVNINPNAKINDLIDTIRKQLENTQLLDLKAKQEQLQELVGMLEKQQADYISIQTQIAGQGYARLRDLREAQVKIEERYFALSAADNAADRTLADIQNVDLASIYDQIAKIWNNFIQYGKWHLRFDADGNPILNQDESRDFDLTQFSGGEKTALLVMIHTIIAHHFSKCNFLMVDEPLEHLDPNNRRSLMGFFIAACQNKYFDQALITTYEESLVRKYISDKNVNILYIR